MPPRAAIQVQCTRFLLDAGNGLILRLGRSGDVWRVLHALTSVAIDRGTVVQVDSPTNCSPGDAAPKGRGIDSETHRMDMNVLSMG